MTARDERVKLIAVTAATLHPATFVSDDDSLGWWRAPKPDRMAALAVSHAARIIDRAEYNVCAEPAAELIGVLGTVIYRNRVKPILDLLNVLCLFPSQWNNIEARRAERLAYLFAEMGDMLLCANRKRRRR